MFNSPWQKPFRGIPLNKTHPLAPDYSWIINEVSGHTVYEHCEGIYYGIMFAGVTRVDGEKGPAIDCPGGANDETKLVAVPAQLTVGTTYTLIVGLFLDAITGDLIAPANSADFSYLLSQDGTTLYHCAGGSYGSISHACAIGDVVFAMSRNGARAVKFYENGQYVGTITLNGDGAFTVRSIIGRHDGVNPVDGRTFFVHIYKRQLSDAAIHLLSSQPYCMFQQPSRAKYFYVAEAPPEGIVPLVDHHYRQMRT